MKTEVSVPDIQPDPPSPSGKSLIGPLLCLGLALIWVALVRIPLILNAPIHLDSDLAVDGLTLLEATQGHLRWHFPGTPYIGTAPVILALPAALLFGVTPWTLVLGGVLAYECVVIATFFLCWRILGRTSAMASLVPLAFASAGTVWLSGRLSGGHLLTVAWFAGTLILFQSYFSRGGTGRALALGVATGLAFSIDSMFLAMLPAMALVSLWTPSPDPTIVRKMASLLVFVVGFALGDLPREVGYRVDAHDSYGEQFNTIIVRHPSGRLEGQIDRAQTRELAVQHLRIFTLECLPRLITGHSLRSSRLPRDPGPDAFNNVERVNPPSEPSITSVLTVMLAGGAFTLSIFLFLSKLFGKTAPAGRATLWLILLTSGTILVGFVTNKNIFNSDNYRYLGFLIVPWALGFGCLFQALWQRGAGGKTAALLIAGSLAVVFSLDTRQWYESYGWVEGVRPRAVPLRDPAYDWLVEHPEVEAIFGDYWDVYRLAFLREGKVQGLPFPVYPDRYDAAKRYPARRPRTLIGRRGHFGDFYAAEARKDGGTVLFRKQDVTIMDWPTTR